MKSVERYPQFQGDSSVIQFLSHEEHLAAHNGNYKNPCSGLYNLATGRITAFPEESYTACEIVDLTNPVSSADPFCLPDGAEEEEGLSR